MPASGVIESLVNIAADDLRCEAMLLCAVGRRVCALPVAVVIETMRPMPLEALAGMPAFVLGLAVIRGRPVPVLDLGQLLGGGHASAASIMRFVTVRVGQREVACAVATTIGVRRIPRELLGCLPPLLREAEAEVVATVGSLDRELLLVLDAARLMPHEAWSRLGIPGGPDA